MNLLFYDTETTGFTKPKLSFTHPTQPHLVQIGAILCDEEGNHLDEQDQIVRPDGWLIPDIAASVHGISTQRAYDEGKDFREVYTRYQGLRKQAALVVCHNSTFDEFVISCAGARLNDPPYPVPSRCTMLELTDVCKIPNRWGKNKWPKLQEAHEFAFGTQFDSAHSAMADLLATKRLFFWAVKEGHIKL